MTKPRLLPDHLGDVTHPVNQVVSPNEGMDAPLEGYLAVGQSALKVIPLAQLSARTT